MFNIFRFFIRISSFLGKELTEIFRQPRLILTLILGPFLIMLLFGIAYPDQTRPLRTLFIVDDQNPMREQVESFASSLSQAITYQGIENDQNLAFSKLALNQVDMIIAVPENPIETIQNNEQARFLVYHNEVDPYQVGYIRFVASEFVEEINRRVLRTMTEQGQEDAETVQTSLEASIANARTMREALTAGEMNTAIAQQQELNSNVDFVRLAIATTIGMFSGVDATTGAAPDQNQQEVLASLDAVNQSLTALGPLDPNASATDRTETIAQITAIEQNLTTLNEKLTTFRSLESGILVSPFTYETSGLIDVSYTPTEFFSAAVIVLLLQHLSVTFAALSIVRERRSGIMELFRVSPITAFEALLGKFMSYLFFGALLAAAITVLVVWVLGVPMLGNWGNYAAALAILIFASLGVGFFISLVAENDIQAAQFSMLFLLTSIFFSGFFMDLRLMWEPLKVLAWSLPATYGISMLQDVMLRGYAAPTQIFLGISAIGVTLFLINWLLLRRKMETY